MAKKKYKKRHSQSTMNAKRQIAESRLAEEKSRAQNRMDPTARNLLFGDLVFLGVCQLLYSNGMMSETASLITTIIGFVMIVLALWFQFGHTKDKRDGSGWGF